MNASWTGRVEVVAAPAPPSILNRLERLEAEMATAAEAIVDQGRREA